MNRIRAWIVRTVFGRAQSEAPGDGLLRVGHPGRKEWLSVYDSETAEAHVIPIDDEVPHVEAHECICGPTPELIERPTGDAWLLTHHSLDGRERHE